MAKRPTGKIAELPKELRDGVNELLRDGATYPRVQAWLNERQQEISLGSVETWSKGGHRQWLKERERLEEMTFRNECALDFAKKHGEDKTHEMGLRLAVSQIYDVLSDFDIETLKQMLNEQPERYTALLSVLMRLSKGFLDIERFKANVAEQKRKIEAELGAAKSGGGLTAEGISAIREALNLM